MSSASARDVRRPLSGLARSLLVVTTAATIALFYLALSLTTLVLLAWIGLLLVAIILAARFGLSGFIVRHVESDFRLVGLIARSMWLSRGLDPRLPLRREQAPRLFALVERLAAQFGIPAPDELCVEMSSGAWVEMRGLKLGLGRTRIGLGYDLLAALSEQEVEAVLAHELAHAKLIGRFVHNWMRSGLNRAAQLSTRLQASVDEHRRAERSFVMGPPVLALSDALTRLAARQIAAYSRQEEFEADRGAAKFCGAAPLRSSLARLDAVATPLARLPWNERVARIESPRGLSTWLVGELARTAAAPAENAPEVFDRYASHPTRADRSAALPEDGSSLRADSPNGLTLLEEADAIARQLVAKIEQLSVEEERRNRRDLAAALRRTRRNSTDIRAAQLPGVLFILVGVVFGLVALFTDLVGVGVVLLFGAVPLGWWLYVLGRKRTRRALPVPDFDTFINARKDYPLPDLDERQKVIEEELRALVAALPKAKQKAARLIDEAYTALGRCDYLRAHVAARLAETGARDDTERHCAMVVASSAFNQHDISHALLTLLLKSTGWRGHTPAWAVAWALGLQQDWVGAEALLWELHEARPAQAGADWLVLLALVQGRRGKLHSAIDGARRSLQAHPDSIERRKLLISLLLERGSLGEAGAELDRLPAAALTDPDCVAYRVRWHLLRDDLPAAEQAVATLDLAALPAHRVLSLAQCYESARADARAIELYRAVLARGHFPQAHLALARHHLEARDKEQARAAIRAALDTSKPVAEHAASTADLFHHVLALQLALEEPIERARAWLARVLAGRDAGLLQNRVLMVYAADEASATRHFLDVLHALKPGEPPLAAAYTLLEPAPRDLQPDRPVRPGVQHVYR